MSDEPKVDRPDEIWDALLGHNSSWPWIPTGMFLLGVALMILAVLAKSWLDGYGLIVLTLGGFLFAIGLKTTIMEMPEIRVPSWFGLAIVLLLGLPLPVFVAAMWVMVKLGWIK
jgi:hypothetical protein